MRPDAAPRVGDDGREISPRSWPDAGQQSAIISFSDDNNLRRSLGVSLDTAKTISSCQPRRISLWLSWEQSATGRGPIPTFRRPSWPISVCPSGSYEANMMGLSARACRISRPNHSESGIDRPPGVNHFAPQQRSQQIDRVISIFIGKVLGGTSRVRPAPTTGSDGMHAERLDRLAPERPVLSANNRTHFVEVLRETRVIDAPSGSGSNTTFSMAEWCSTITCLEPSEFETMSGTSAATHSRPVRIVPRLVSARKAEQRTSTGVSASL